MRSQQFLYNYWLGLKAQCHHRCNLVHRTSTPQETFWFLWDANSDKTAVFDVLGMRMVWKLIPAHTFVLAGYSARERWWEFNKQRDKRDKLGWSPSKSQQCGAWRQWATCRWSDDCMKSWNKKGNNSRWLQRGRNPSQNGYKRKTVFSFNAEVLRLCQTPASAAGRARGATAAQR